MLFVCRNRKGDRLFSTLVNSSSVVNDCVFIFTGSLCKRFNLIYERNDEVLTVNIQQTVTGMAISTMFESFLFLNHYCEMVHLNCFSDGLLPNM